MTDLSRYLERYTEDNEAVYVADIDAIEGDVSDAIQTLQAIAAMDAQAIVVDGGDVYDGHHWQITWRRPMRPEEIAKRERDQREAEAKRNTDRYAAERREYERLKAKFEMDPLKETPGEDDA